MRHHLRRLWFETEGQDLSEYALLLILGCLIAVAAMETFAVDLSHLYTTSSAHFVTTLQHKSVASHLAGHSQSVDMGALKTRKPGGFMVEPPSRSNMTR